MNRNDIPTITPTDEGTWVSGSAHHTADEISAHVILTAVNHGWDVPDDGFLALCRALTESGGHGRWVEDPDDSQALSDATYEAIDYLNTRAPEGYLFTLDDGLYLMAVCGEEGYRPDYDGPCPHGAQCPNL